MTFYPPQGPQPPYGPPSNQPWPPTPQAPVAASPDQASASRLRAISIAFIVLGALDLAIGALATCSRIGSLGASQGRTSAISSDHPAELAGYLFYVALTLLSFVVGALVLTAGIRLSRRRGRGLGITAAIVAMLPISCAFLLGIPIGIWALVTLGRDDVRALLATTPAPQAFYPPPPAGYPPTY